MNERARRGAMLKQAEVVSPPLTREVGAEQCLVLAGPSLLFLVVACVLEDKVGRGNVQAPEDKEQS
ncbi:hypothetical protein C5167_031071 [Papaver somniferum]|nr:hypothetical protein C5167_031071 [Papaver somniferum]